MKKFSSRNLFKVLVAVAFFLMLVFWNPYKIFNPFRIFFSKLAYPFESLSYSFSRKVDIWSDFVFSIGRMRTENEKLLKEKQELLAENSRLHDVERENVFLREQVGLLPQEKYELQAATIISQDPQGIGKFIEIDKGLKDGLKEGMAVIVSKGIMIGRLEKVSSGQSMVALNTNPKSAINALVAQSGAKALVRGEYGLGMFADSILQTDSVSIGDEIVTSGMGGEIPKGLLLGIVQEVRPSSDHLFRQAAISSPVEISKLEAVFVIKNEKS